MQGVPGEKDAGLQRSGAEGEGKGGGEPAGGRREDLLERKGRADGLRVPKVRLRPRAIPAQTGGNAHALSRDRNLL